MKAIANFINRFMNALMPGTDWANIKPATWFRWALAALTTINNVLIVCGVGPIDVNEDDLYFVISVVVNIVVLLVNTYKDNPTSKEGIFTNELMKILKSSATDENAIMDQIRELLNAPKTSDPKEEPNSPRSPTDSESSESNENNNDTDETGDADIEEVESSEEVSETEEPETEETSTQNE